jgi:hypothetical protein
VPEPDNADMQALRREVLARYGTIHAFCRAVTGLNRATVYMVLAGSYPGNVQRQAARIRDALDGRGNRETQVFRAIKDVACARCAVNGPCNRCDELFRDQARAVLHISQVT